MDASPGHHLLQKEASLTGLRDAKISGYSDKPLGIGLIFCLFSRIAAIKFTSEPYDLARKAQLTVSGKVMFHASQPKAQHGWGKGS